MIAGGARKARLRAHAAEIGPWLGHGIHSDGALEIAALE
jgi:hypothetical protein